MSERFDPYYSWLGIPPKDQPPHHYRLLGIEPLENNTTVIENAADQRMAHLRPHQAGKHSALSQKLLNEVAAAKVCLLNPEKKAAYDTRLREQLAASVRPAGGEEAEPDPAFARLVERLQPADSPTTGSAAAKPPRLSKALLAAAGGAVVVLLALALVWWALGRGGTPGDMSDSRVGRGTSPTDSTSHVALDDGGGTRSSSHPTSLTPTAPPAPAESARPKSDAPSDAAPENTATPAEPLKPNEVAKADVATEQEKTSAAPKGEKVAPKNPPAEKSPPEEDQAPAKKIEPPSLEEQKRLIATIDEIYKTGEAKDQAAKAAVARKLLEDGRKNEGNRAEQFVLLRRASELARDAGEANLMLDTVDAMAAAGFNIQPFPLQARLLKRLVEQCLSGGAPQRSTIIVACVKFAEAAASGGAVQEASDVLGAAREGLAEPRKRAQQALRSARTAMARTRKAAEKPALEKKVTEAERELEAIDEALSSVTECTKGLQQAWRLRAVSGKAALLAPGISANR